MKLVYSVEGSIGRIVLCNPPYNYLPEPGFEHPEILRDFFSQPQLRAVIVAGSGRHFCAGADPQALSQMLHDTEMLRRKLTDGKALLDIIRYATVPVAAVIRGSCLGGGFEIALACHFRFAATSALFGFPESGLGVLPGLGGTVASQETAHRAGVIDLAVSGRMIGAAEAVSMGLVDKSCEPRAVEHEAGLFLERLTAGRPAPLVRKIMESIHNARRFPMEKALSRETELFCEAARDSQ